MRKIKIYAFAVITMFCITGNGNSSNPPSKAFYFHLNHHTVVKELTNTVDSLLDKATNDNIINMVQNTTNELNNICEYTNNSDDNLVNQINEYTSVVRKLSDDFTQVSQTLEKDKQRKMSDSIDECLFSCKETLRVIENKPVKHSSLNQMSILDALKLNNK